MEATLPSPHLHFYPPAWVVSSGQAFTLFIITPKTLRTPTLCSKPSDNVLAFLAPAKEGPATVEGPRYRPELWAGDSGPALEPPHH